ncbi:MAG TPA: hypothetical protein VFD52_01555 [Clostridia bacterium]|nr:hypothetical protein [Clostridia bacterium]
MARFFIQNHDIRKEFDKLPSEVKTRIIETNIQVNSVAELDKLADSIKKSFE